MPLWKPNSLSLWALTMTSFRLPFWPSSLLCPFPLSWNFRSHKLIPPVKCIVFSCFSVSCPKSYCKLNLSVLQCLSLTFYFPLFFSPEKFLWEWTADKTTSICSEDHIFLKLLMTPSKSQSRFKNLSLCSSSKEGGIKVIFLCIYFRNEKKKTKPNQTCFIKTLVKEKNKSKKNLTGFGKWNKLAFLY